VPGIKRGAGVSPSGPRLRTGCLASTRPVSATRETSVSPGRALATCATEQSRRFRASLRGMARPGSEASVPSVIGRPGEDRGAAVSARAPKGGHAVCYSVGDWFDTPSAGCSAEVTVGVAPSRDSRPQDAVCCKAVRSGARLNRDTTRQQPNRGEHASCAPVHRGRSDVLPLLSNIAI
jgi:hypothetical protein